MKACLVSLVLIFSCIELVHCQSVDCTFINSTGSREIIMGAILFEAVNNMAIKQGAVSVVISAKIEEEIAVLEEDSEKTEFLETLGLKETGLTRVIRAGYELLDLITFFTVGPKEAHAWTISKNATASQAAGVIHTDFEKGFIKAETIAYEDFIDYNGEQGAKEAGKMRQEGRDYQTQDGDIMLFRFNV